MANTKSPEFRSWNMSRIRGANTRIEVLVRSQLHRLGFRFTVHGRRNKELPGKPDIVLPRFATVVFVHGCFWHQHEACREGRKPHSNQEYWDPKLARTIARDAENAESLRKLGWKTVTLWECEIERAQRTGSLSTLLSQRVRHRPFVPDTTLDPSSTKAAEDAPGYRCRDLRTNTAQRGKKH